ncbi:MAG: hypothetical protein ACKVX7_19660 [Planctomycetota bacterium]
MRIVGVLDFRGYEKFGCPGRSLVIFAARTAREDTELGLWIGPAETCKLKGGQLGDIVMVGTATPIVDYLWAEEALDEARRREPLLKFEHQMRYLLVCDISKIGGTPTWRHELLEHQVVIDGAPYQIFGEFVDSDVLSKSGSALHIIWQPKTDALHLAHEEICSSDGGSIVTVDASRG